MFFISEGDVVIWFVFHFTNINIIWLIVIYFESFITFRWYLFYCIAKYAFCHLNFFSSICWNLSVILGKSFNLSSDVNGSNLLFWIVTFLNLFFHSLLSKFSPNVWYVLFNFNWSSINFVSHSCNWSCFSISDFFYDIKLPI